MGSTRLPGKPLLPIGGTPLIERTFKNVSRIFSNVVVATDAKEIAAFCDTQNIPVVLTQQEHLNGTTRMLEAYNLLDTSAEYVINVQGDEAFIGEEQLLPLCELLQNKSPEAATLMAPIPSYDSDSNVYVTTDLNQRALLFSRSPIPFHQTSRPAQRFQHIGVYAYKPEALKRYCGLAPTPLEMSESLEQLRWMEHGFDWYVATAASKPLSIDTPKDVELAESLLKQA